jgi:Asp-tRNA(Asn)/Glu-tRNA(Gln) amidotransferase C subunit
MSNAPTKPATLEEVAAAAKEFERILNSAEANLKVEVDGITYSTSEASRNIYRIHIRTDDQVYP